MTASKNWIAPAKGTAILIRYVSFTKGAAATCVQLTSHQTISTLSIPLPPLKDEQLDIIDAWLRSVLWENMLLGGTTPGTKQFEIHRLKGRLVLESGVEKMIQGVREVFEIFDNPSQSSEKGGVGGGKVVLIGRHLGDHDFPGDLQRALGLKSS